LQPWGQGFKSPHLHQVRDVKSALGADLDTDDLSRYIQKVRLTTRKATVNEVLFDNRIGKFPIEIF
jgi:hypothetical protein